jgi:hypothetical protein
MTLDFTVFSQVSNDEEKVWFLEDDLVDNGVKYGNAEIDHRLAGLQIFLPFFVVFIL